MSKKICNSIFLNPAIQHLSTSLRRTLVRHTSIQLFCLSLSVLSVLIFFSSCENKREEIDKFTAKDLSREKADSVNINYTIAGKSRAHLTSPLMYRMQDTAPYVEFPNTLHVNFYNGDTIITSLLDAKYAKYYEAKSLVFLKDSVRIINIEKGDTLYTDELYWDRNKTNTEFYTDKPVKIRTRTQLINGIGMESKQDFKDWHIRQSTGIIKVPNSEFPN